MELRLKKYNINQNKQGREHIRSETQIKQDTITTNWGNSENGDDYSTSDEESDSSIRGITTRITEEKRIKSHRNEDLPPTNQAQYTIGECVNTDQAINDVWNTDELIMLVTALIKHNNDRNRASSPRLKFPYIQWGQR
uniref:Uncharacterized protein n=1 Tax=Heterorhabditis bacteriophora TaxID=37862 RepID=A0A1I7WGZ1_HETBA